MDDTTRRNRPPRQAIAVMTPELRAKWRTRYCPNDDVDLRAHALVERTADEMRAAGDEVTVRTVWIALADRYPVASEDTVLWAAAGLARMALGLV